MVVLKYRRRTDPRLTSQPSFFERVYAVVRQIPRGAVATYGHVAAAAGNPRAARMVGWALHATPPAMRLPWQRVVNREGGISLRHNPAARQRQRILLEHEGIVFDGQDRIDLAAFGWHCGQPASHKKSARLRPKTGAGVPSVRRA